MYFALAALVLLRLFLAYKVPILADEAYYVFWGTHPAGGYYDLPPMIGWWEAVISKFSLHPFFIRLPNLIVMALVAGGIYDVMKRFGKERAKLLAILFFVLPIHLLGVIVSPDLPLIFFSFCAGVLFFFSDQKLLLSHSSREVWSGRLGYFLSGCLWGAAFLSKYFAVMLVPGILLWIWISRKGTRTRVRALGELFWVILGALPFLFQHIYWNSKNCMANFVFNLISRQNASDGSVFLTFGFYILYLLILVTPVFYCDLFKSSQTQLVQSGKERNFFQFEEEKNFKTFCLLMWAVPIVLFGLTALMSKGQGIHWYLSYIPFFLMWLSFKFSDSVMLTRTRAMMALSGLLIVVTSVLLCMPEVVTDKILKGRYRLDVETSIRGEELAKQLAPLAADADAVLTGGYVFSSVLDMQLRRYNVLNAASRTSSVAMWGGGSRFGRVFDWVSDFRALHGKTILLVSSTEVGAGEFGNYFLESKTEKFLLGTAEYFVMTGKGFKSEEYIERILVPVIHQFYPSFFLQTKCSVRDKIL